jgi:hypothetical protein
MATESHARTFRPVVEVEVEVVEAVAVEATLSHLHRPNRQS